jgi:preprotein translocase subunit SecE
MMVSSKQNDEQTTADTLKWLFVIAVVIAGIIANYWYAEVDTALRVAAGIVIIGISLAVASQTGKGRQFWAFAKDARHEMRKVVWPSRQETIKNTVMVVIIVALMSCFLWGIDALLAWLISRFVG